jgi:hypothetical protein
MLDTGELFLDVRLFFATPSILGGAFFIAGKARRV